MIRMCLHCDAEFRVKISPSRLGRDKYCSKVCMWEHRRENPSLMPGDRGGIFKDELWGKLYKRLSGIQQRCHNPKHDNFKNYGGRGIKCLLTYPEIKALWVRDNADSLNVPTIDRVDNDGDYVFSNCRFIEKSANSKRMMAERVKKTGRYCLTSKGGK